MPKILSSLTYIGPTFCDTTPPFFSVLGTQKKGDQTPLEFSGAMESISPSKTQWLFDADFMLLEDFHGDGITAYFRWFLSNM